ncbi:hypothetical protein FA95DRAFT_1611471 [Auriscalpium vulgare]|uniref:Uncharacterized protein n=1 Tax=Auriscalpium vulgare TaxID=40419 RepID=A0ACB8RA05_9AGAM|nr:hypothetical protein FA95DRAFT_1611471 [Auriscalpium vulgare]
MPGQAGDTHPEGQPGAQDRVNVHLGTPSRVQIVYTPAPSTTPSSLAITFEAADQLAQRGSPAASSGQPRDAQSPLLPPSPIRETASMTPQSPGGFVTTKGAEIIQLKGFQDNGRGDAQRMADVDVPPPSPRRTSEGPNAQAAPIIPTLPQARPARPPSRHALQETTELPFSLPNNPLWEPPESLTSPRTDSETSFDDYEVFRHVQFPPMQPERVAPAQTITTQPLEPRASTSHIAVASPCAGLSTPARAADATITPLPRPCKTLHNGRNALADSMNVEPAGNAKRGCEVVDDRGGIRAKRQALGD